QVRFTPLKYRLERRPPFLCEPTPRWNGEPMLRAIPNLSRQQPPGQRLQQRFQISVYNFLPRRQRKYTIQDNFIQVWDTNFERGQHARPVRLDQTIFAKIRLQIRPHQNVHVETAPVASGTAFPRLEICVNGRSLFVNTV